MTAFKLLFPAPYSVHDVNNDNLDLNIVFEDGAVYFVTAFTPANLAYLMQKWDRKYFWAADPFIVEDLHKQTLRNAIQQVIEDGYWTHIFSRIGNIQDVYGGRLTFDSIDDDTV